MDKQDLIPLIQRVAELRDRSDEMLKNRDLLHQRLMQTSEGKEHEATCKDIVKLTGSLIMAEAELKEKAVALYQTTQEKKPVGKVEIKIYKRLSYGVTEILKWCRENAPSLLIVNKKPFEKTAVEIGAPVEVTEEAKCTIGTDLSSYLNTKEEVKENGQR